MSGQATGWVLRHGPRDRAMRAVLITIADAADRDGRHSHPGIAAMVEGSLYSRAHVLATVQRLAAAGWVTITDPGGGRGRATTYDIPGVLDAPTGYPENRPATGPPATSETVQSDNGNSPLSTRNRPVTSPSSRTNAAPTVCSTETINETTSSRGDQLALAPPADAPTGPPFDDFWEAWPPRNGRRLYRGKALEQWRRLKPAEQRAAIVGARNYADASARRLAGAMDAFRWLRDQCWPDWQEPLPPDAGRRPRPGSGPPPARSAVMTDRRAEGASWRPGQ